MNREQNHLPSSVPLPKPSAVRILFFFLHDHDPVVLTYQHRHSSDSIHLRDGRPCSGSRTPYLGAFCLAGCEYGVRARDERHLQCSETRK
jgi:hypothetical protein